MAIQNDEEETIAAELVVREEVRKWKTRLDESESQIKEFRPEIEANYTAVYGPDWMKDGKRGGGSETSKATSSIRKYQYDILLAFLKTEVPSLILYRPEVFLTANEAAMRENPMAEDEAKLYQDEFNRILGDLDGFEFEIKSAIADAHCAWGVIKVIGDPIWDTPPDQMEEVFMGTRYDLYRVDPLKFRIDPKCKNDPNKARWKGEELERSLQEMTDSGLYNVEVLGRLREKLNKKDKDDWEIYVTFCEIYDKVSNRIIAICPEFDEDFLRNEEMPLGVSGDPYCILKFTEIPGQFIPKFEISSGRQLQQDSTDVRQWMKVQARKSVPKTGVRGKLAQSDEEQQKLRDGTSDIVKCNPGDVFPINNDLKLGSAVKDHLSLVDGDFDEVMGQPSQDRGIVGEAKFATEAQIAEAQGNVRERDKLSTVKVWLGSMFEKILFHMKYGGIAKLKNLNVNLDLDLDIDIESKTPKGKAIDRKQLTEALATIVQNPIFMQSPTLLEQVFRDYDIRNSKKIIAELQAAMAAQQQGQPKEPVSQTRINIAVPWELLNPEAKDKIMDLAFQADIPIPVGTPGNGGGTVAPPGTTREGVDSGLEGLRPEAGL
jgi:hypothetical protein